MKKYSLKTSALALAMFASLPSMANTVSINFDNVPSGSQADTAVPSWIHFFQAQYVNDVNSDGDEILNTEKFQIDAQSNAQFPVLVENPSTYGYGNAPSGFNALNALSQPVLMRFDTVQNLSNFSVTLDNSAFGDLSTSFIYFLGTSKEILSQVAYSQTVPGAIVSLAHAVNGVKEVVFSSGAFYDNMSIETAAPVPLPATFPLLISGLAALGFIKRRKNV